jgi:hypothetical protein
MSESNKKTDYLEVDDVIPGQNYVCLSFLSPESLMQNKDAFKCVKFLQSYCKEQKLIFNDVYSKYQDFTYKYEEKLQRDFDEQNNFQTSMRGLKVRGVFDTRQAAEDKAKRLSVMDTGFHTFVGQVGYWLPWDPNADKVADEIFQNSQLNDMMEKYQENNVSRDMFYEEQKRDKIKAANEERLKAEAENKKKKDLENKDASEEYPIEEDSQGGGSIEDLEPEPETENTEERIIGFSPTTSKKPTETEPENKQSEPEPENKQSEPEPENKEPELKKGSEVSEDIKDSLDDDDPWMKRKEEGNK